jgi:hypothetical protein
LALYSLQIADLWASFRLKSKVRSNWPWITIVNAEISRQIPLDEFHPWEYIQMSHLKKQPHSMPCSSCPRSAPHSLEILLINSRVFFGSFRDKPENHTILCQFLAKVVATETLSKSHLRPHSHWLSASVQTAKSYFSKVITIRDRLHQDYSFLTNRTSNRWCSGSRSPDVHVPPAFPSSTKERR